MPGWIVPPASEPTKSPRQLAWERRARVRRLVRDGYLTSERIRRALLAVRREVFVPRLYRDHAYEEVPLPLPGEQATISCPHSYPLFYEPLGLGAGHRFLEVGLGSGYGAAVAREVVGSEGLVVSVEIDPVTLRFACGNLEGAGYHDVVLVEGDGSRGHPPLAPYDRIAVTAATDHFPEPLVDQLAEGGRLIGPIMEGASQLLTLLEKGPGGIETRTLCEVLYVYLQGEHGFPLFPRR